MACQYIRRTGGPTLPDQLGLEKEEDSQLRG